MEVNLPSEVNLKSLLAIRKFVILPAITAGVVVLLTVFFLAPQVRSIVTNREEKARLEEELEGLEDKAEFLQEIDRNELTKQVEVIEEVLPSSKVVVGWMNSLQAMANESKVVLGVIALKPGSIATEAAEGESQTPVRSRGKGDVSEVKSSKFDIEYFEIDLEVSGDIEGINEFLSRVETTSPLMRLGSLSISPNIRNRGGKILEEGLTGKSAMAELSVLLFYTSPPSDLGTISSKVIPINSGQAEIYEEILAYQRYPESTTSATKVGRENIFAPF